MFNMFAEVWTTTTWYCSCIQLLTAVILILFLDGFIVLQDYDSDRFEQQGWTLTGNQILNRYDPSMCIGNVPFMHTIVAVICLGPLVYFMGAFEVMWGSHLSGTIGLFYGSLWSDVG